jgi:GWxTD domain-containing protein
MTYRTKWEIYILFIAITTIIFLGFSDCDTLLEAKEKKQTLKDWYRGPVRYLIAKEEEIIFKSLETEEERAAFINRFWRRRDPTPGTHQNEFRYSFWKRVTDANTLYIESAKPGWKTDRGKVYIIMGPPQEIEDDSYYSSAGSPSSGSEPRALIRWIYQGTGRKNIDPLIAVPFVKDKSGEYRLSSDPRLNSLFYDRLRSYDRGDLGLLDQVKRFDQESISELAVTLDQGKLQQLPPEEEIYTEIITDKEYYGAIPLRSRYDFYQSEEISSTLTSMTIEISKSDIPSFQLSLSESPQLSLLARFIGAGDKVISYTFPEGSFLPSPLNERSPQGNLLYQMKAPITPGKYKILIGIFDQGAEFIGSFQEFMDIPAIFHQRLSLSSILLAEKLEQREASAQGFSGQPFQFGDFLVIPKLYSRFKEGDFFDIFYQIYYHPQNLDGIPEQEIALLGSYEILRKDDRGDFQKLWKPIPFEVQVPPSTDPITINRGWSFKIDPLPAGDFKLQIHVAHEGQDLSAEKEIEFTVED